MSEIGDHKMRAKVRVSGVFPFQDDKGATASERLMFAGVCKNEPYGEDGLDENNTFAKFSPSVSLDMLVSNPALLGVFEPGDTFYVDFSIAPK